MKTQRVNPNGMNPMQMNNMSSMMGMMNNIQRIGKGKRKITVNLDKNNKKFLSKFIEEVKKQFATSAMGVQASGLGEFFDYVKSVADTKDQMELKLSFEEYEFLKRMIVDSIKGMEGMTFKWYQFVKKAMLKVMVKQYRELLTKFK
ncbi:hypothetical protein [Fusobacterium mortiferum]|uniref:DUF327 family protein n=1 Tax=Fusobacterium mortiferum TaxID=850 RepID=A0ABS2FY43_FUSMR|nr:hypothetical protein [Fusobacterium mortiferum]MBM6821268.1 hypothetical protein [Fusobacterium mortiferum]MBM6874071.1 hypothetical protein [Fusobacterium mortiferum]